MVMRPGFRDFALTAHVVCSVGWLGAVAAYLGLVAALLTSESLEVVRAAWVAMDLIGWTVIVPLALAALLTGLVMSLGTSWGLFRHYWVLFKLLLTTLAIIILVMHMPTVSIIVDAAPETMSAHARNHGPRAELLHAGGGLVVLLVVATLSVYKPRGMTAYGRRRQNEERTGSHAEVR